MRTPTLRRGILLACTAAASAGLLAACGGDVVAPELVAFVGRLIDEDGAGVADADVWVSTRDGAAVLASTRTEGDGRFVAGGLEKNIEVALVFSGPDDTVRTVFSGETEENHMFLFTGAVFVRDLAGQQDVVDEYTAAIGATNALMTFDRATPGSGAMVRGRVVRVIEDAGGLYYENVPGAEVTVEDGAGVQYPVLYRGDYPNDTDPGPIEPGRTQTGEDARFVAFAVSTTGGAGAFPFPANAVTVTVLTPDGSFSEETLVVEDGVTVFDLFTVP